VLIVDVLAAPDRERQSIQRPELQAIKRGYLCVTPGTLYVVTWKSPSQAPRETFPASMARRAEPRPVRRPITARAAPKVNSAAHRGRAVMQALKALSPR
jgi:hypothetical protein